MGEQLRDLATPVPDQFIGDNGRNLDAMDHSVATQLLLAKLGAFSFEIVKEYYGGGKGQNAKDTDLTGVLGRLTVEIDGREVTVQEPGGVQNVGNIDGNGERAKHAASDSLKRCAMRLGLGLHIWAQDKYFLDKLLDKREDRTDEEVMAESSPDPNNTPGVERGGARRISRSQGDEIMKLAQEAYEDDYIQLMQEMHLAEGQKLKDLTFEQAQDLITVLKQEVMAEA